MRELGNGPSETNVFFATELMKQWFQMMNLPQEEYRKMVGRYFEVFTHSTRVSVEWHGNIAHIIRNPEDVTHLPYMSDARVYAFPKTCRFQKPK